MIDNEISIEDVICFWHNENVSKFDKTGLKNHNENHKPYFKAVGDEFVSISMQKFVTNRLHQSQSIRKQLKIDWSRFTTNDT